MTVPSGNSRKEIIFSNGGRVGDLNDFTSVEDNMLGTWTLELEEPCAPISDLWMLVRYTLEG